MATQSNIHAWKIPWAEEPGGPLGDKESVFESVVLTEHTRTYHFSRLYIYTQRLRYNTCFSLSDLLHSVCHSLSPSTSRQMT